MASTYDSLLRLELQATGENVNTWGEKTNNNLGLIAAAIAGSTSISIAGSGTYTLTTANAATDQARQAVITLTGLLTGNRTIIVPSSSKIYFVRNNTTGAFTVTFKTASGAGAIVPQGYVLAIVCDGTDCFDASEVARVAKAGDTMTGLLTLSGPPTVDLHAATKKYVDDVALTRVAKTGDTMTGALTLPAADPTNVNHAARKAYVDTKVAKAGDTMTGALLLPDGNAAAPALSFSGDTNTGIYRSAADQVAVSTNGVLRARFGNTDSYSFTNFRISTNSQPTVLGVDTDPSQVGQLDYTEEGVIRWRLQKWSQTDPDFYISSYNSSGVFVGHALAFNNVSLVATFGAIPVLPASDPTTANQAARKAYVDAKAAQAWVNFNGTGTVAIRASFNVTSITDYGTGNYDVNFTNALADTNYSVVATASQNAIAANALVPMVWGAGRATTAVRIGVSDNNTDALFDAPNIDVAVFR